MLRKDVIIALVLLGLSVTSASAQSISKEEQQLYNDATAVKGAIDAAQGSYLHLNDALSAMLQRQNAERAALIDANAKIDWLWKNFGQPAYKDSER